VIEQLLRSAKPSHDGFVAVKVEPAELTDIAPTVLTKGIHVQVMTPRALHARDVAMEAVDISRSGDELVIDITRYRERDEWELSITPETYERLFEHVVTIWEDSVGRDTPLIGERVRYYKPALSPTDVQMTVGVLLDSARVPDLAAAYLIGLRVAAQIHAATLRLALTDEGARVVHEARPDPAVPVADYLRLTSHELARRKGMFDVAIAQTPRRLSGVFDAGLVTVELTRVTEDRYQVQVISVLARSGKITTIRPVLVSEVAAWCKQNGAPVDAFEWNTC